MQITLSTTPSSESWGKNAILSFNQKIKPLFILKMMKNRTLF